MFHGVGGVGKSTLLRKIESALTAAEQRPQQWGAPAWASETILPVRIDLSRSASMDFERVVLTIRLALAAAVGHPMSSFDLALRRYWDAQHPGEPLEEYVRRTGLVGKFGQLLPQQMQSAVTEAASALKLPGLVGSAAGQVATALVRALRERRERARAPGRLRPHRRPPGADPDLEALSYYPHLLAWEISRLPTKRAVVPVILLDTFEDTGDRHRDTERLLQRLVWLMPNAFFVIAGRNRLAWADPALQGQLDFTGPDAWPGLAPQAEQPARAAGGDRQHLIGDFSPRGLRRLPRTPPHPRRPAADHARHPRRHHRTRPRAAAPPGPGRRPLPGDPPHRPHTHPRRLRPHLPRPHRPHPLRPHRQRAPRPAQRQPPGRLRPGPGHPSGGPDPPGRGTQARRTADDHRESVRDLAVPPARRHPQRATG
ncbi:hypothetical protein [Streptomyces asiaticus]|uniref:hypothetical protein n=1 Tax=Streptomyces asiaticus TaxID=114695 RepID=UPI003F681792